MGYYIDLSLMSLDNLKEKLLTGDLLKSRMPLREEIDDHFKALGTSEICNAEELKAVLKTKKNVAALAGTTGISPEYLMLLRREVNSYHPQPRKIDKFPLLDKTIKEALLKAGVRTTVDMYRHICTPADRKRLCAQTGLPEEQIVLGAQLTDLCRLQYVNETFATLLVEAGYKTIQSVADADPDELHRKVNIVYKETLLSKCTIGLNDMHYLIRLAKEMSSEI